MAPPAEDPPVPLVPKPPLAAVVAGANPRPLRGGPDGGPYTRLFWRDRVTTAWQLDSQYTFLRIPLSDEKALAALRFRSDYIRRNGAEVRDEAYHHAAAIHFNPFAIRVTFANKSDRDFALTATDWANTKVLLPGGITLNQPETFKARKGATAVAELYEPWRGRPTVSGSWTEYTPGGFAGGGGVRLALFNEAVRHLDAFVITKRGSKYVFARQ